MAEPSSDGISCVLRDCDKAGSSCIYTCVFSDTYFPPPPPPPLPPPPPGARSAQSHVAPYLIATVCILGISFLLLTTCTIILRYHFRRRWRVSNRGADDSPGIDDDLGNLVDHPIWNITTVGLQQSVIDSITAFKYKRVDGFLIEGSDCSVCLTEFDDGDDLRLLPKCSHAFHVSCIDTWLRSHKNCPLCRAPVINEALNGTVGGDLGVRQWSSSNVEETQLESMECNNGGLVFGEGESSGSQRGRMDDIGNLPIEGIRVAEILRKNRNELRIVSDLGVNHRYPGEEDGGERTRRSISFNYSDAMAICKVVGSVSSVGNEGCSSSNRLSSEKKFNFGKAGGNKRGSSMSGLLIKSSSIGRSLQKGPVSMKRSFSSSGKFFSFRRTKSQASILPL